MRPSASSVPHDRKQTTGIDLPPIPGIFIELGRRILLEKCPACFRMSGALLSATKNPRQVGQIPVEGRGKGRAFTLTIPVYLTVPMFAIHCGCHNGTTLEVAAIATAA